MTASRDELHHLIDGLPDDQVSAVAEELRRRMQPRPARTREPFAWIGMIDDPTIPSDVAENLDKYLGGFGATSL